MNRYTIQLTTDGTERGGTTRDALAVAIDVLASAMGRSCAWEAVAFDRSGDAFDSAGHRAEEVES